MRLNLKYWITGILVILLVLFAGISFHQQNHFNRHVTINNVNVGGLTAEQAYQKVKKNSTPTKVYVNNRLVYQATTTTTHFTSQDRSKFTKALKNQRTIFPTGKHIALNIKPANFNAASLAPAKTAVTNEVKRLNVGRKTPVDAYAVYQNGTVKTVAAVNGTKYNLQKVLASFDQQAANSRIELHPSYAKPLSANSKTVKNEKSQLAKLKNKTVTYQVENKKYQFKTDQVITKATYQNGKYSFDTSAVDAKIKQINNDQATLGKAFKFKTHAGNVITTSSNGSYGWKIDASKAGQTLANALANGKKTVNAEHDLTGIGYNQQGTGYNVTSNNGIGNTYAEVSLADQHAWFYQDGKCVLSTDIVSGTNNEGNKTPTGVWYIMYQQSPSVLRGKNDDGSDYASKVTYWSPFTDTGCGFHDASWRHNWSKTAYLKDGSHGCINMQPSVAGTAFHALHKDEPVIIY